MIQRSLPFPSIVFCATLIAGCTSNTSTSRSSAPSVTATNAVDAANVIAPKGTPNFTSKAANFSIYFPVKPTEKRTPGSSQWGSYETFIYQSETKPVSYLVVATTIPAKVDTSDPLNFIDGVQKGLVEEASAKLEKSRDVTLNGIPGREIHTSMNQGAALSRAYIYFTPRISYQVMAVGLKKEIQAQSAQIDKVLGSFRLLDK